jgi:hypothetical protein
MTPADALKALSDLAATCREGQQMQTAHAIEAAGFALTPQTLRQALDMAAGLLRPYGSLHLDLHVASADHFYAAAQGLSIVHHHPADHRPYQTIKTPETCLYYAPSEATHAPPTRGAVECAQRSRTFAVGDRVRCIKSPIWLMGLPVGTTGTLRVDDGSTSMQYGVEWDDFSGGIDLDGALEDGSVAGLWCEADEIEPLPPDPQQRAEDAGPLGRYVVTDLDACRKAGEEG